VLVEDHGLFAEAFSIALSNHGYDVTRVPLPGHVRSVGSIVDPLLMAEPDVVLLDHDLDLPASASAIIAALVRGEGTVVVLTSAIEPASWGECLYHGARRVIPKTAPLKDVLDTLRRIEQRLPVIAPEQRQALIDAWQSEEDAHRDARERLATLTVRERQILDHLLAGRTADGIARVDGVSPGTVRTQIRLMLAKLEVSSRLAAVAIANHAEPLRRPR
jgi:DNA-binding NarL/FixJ family response regulator